jgi:protocatechuate 3,4-dioxygenase beta subunit
MPPTRRQVALSILANAFVSPFLTLDAIGQGLPEALALTPSCTDDDEDLTPPQTEGPYFTTNSPFKQDLSGDGTGGDLLMIGGMVVDATCQPIAGAMLELWHADAGGIYDNEGYRYRGHGFSDEQGRWWFATIVPGLYPGRTRHYHIKVQRPGGQTLTTQLYFPSEQQNSQDRLFSPDLRLRFEQSGSDKFGLFNFVLA